jgi:hypothetical protein
MTDAQKLILSALQTALKDVHHLPEPTATVRTHLIQEAIASLRAMVSNKGAAR